MKHALDKRRRLKRRSVALESLEPRLLLSADLAPALAPFAHDALPPIPAEHRSFEAMAELPRIVMAQEAARASELVFVDATLPDYQRLVADVLRATGGERPVEVILLDPARDGIAQIGAVLATRGGLDAVHLVTHGGDGRLQLGGTSLDAAALEANHQAIAAWARAFSAEGDLLLFGCDVAASPKGAAFIEALARLTGADVAASEDLTGAARLGGDWNLERTTGAIDETLLPLEDGDWDGLLTAQTLDWDNPAVDWTATSLGPTSFAVGGGNVTISITGTTARLNDGSPDDVTNDQGGLAVTEQGLYVSSTGFLLGESAVITIDFSHLGGVSNVSFTIFDIDRGGGPNFIDEVQASYTASGPVTLGIATGPNNILVAPDTVQGTHATTSNGPNSSDANATFTFTGTGITQIKLNYRNAGGATNQSITLHDINFTENSRPSGTDGAAVVNEDTTYSFAAANFGFTDPDAGDILSAVRIDSLPGAGTFVLIGSGAVTTGQVITVADINAGNLRFTPAANANGAAYATFTFSVRDSGGLFDASPNTLTINVTPVNDAPAATNDAYAVNEDGTLNVAAAGVLANDSDIDNPALSAVLVAGPSNGSLTLNASGSFSYAPIANFNGTDSFTYRASDGSLLSNIATVTITVNAVNNPPSAIADAYAVAEDGTLNVPAAGVLANDSDVDGPALSAALVGGPSNAAAFTLNANGSFSYTPTANFNGTDSFTYRASDGSLQSVVVTVTITVNEVNDAPVGSGSARLGAVAEDAASPAGATVSALFAANYSDAADGAGATALAGVAIVGNTATAAQGVWQYSPDGLTWTTIGTALSDAAAVTLPATHLMRFLPAADFNGTPGALSVRLADGSAGAIAVATGVNLGGAVGGTGNWSVAAVALGTSITAVNDAPTFGALGNQTVAEDAAAQTLAGFTTVPPGGGADEAGQTFSYAVTNDNNALFTVQPTIAANGALTYTITPNASGTATVTVFVTDSGGTANFGVDTTGPRTFTISATPVADTPSVTNATTLEDIQSTSGLVITRNAADGAEVAHFKVTGIAGGTLFLSDGTTAVANGFFITAAQGAAGLKFTPTANSIANGAFDVQASTAANDGGLGGGVVTATIAVTAVNDEPSVTLAGNQTAAEDAGAQALAGFAIAAPGGGADEAGQTFSYAVTNDNNALFSVQPTIAANGTLTYTSAPNANGAATVTVTLSDSGRTANGGDDTAPAQTFSININAVADAPSLTVNPAVGHEDTAIPLSIAHALADNDGSETLALTVSAIPVSATLSDGVNAFTAIAGNQSVAITTWNLAQLRITAPLHSDVDFTLAVSATATETANGATATTNANLAVTVNAVADTPTLTVNAASGNEDTAIPLSAAAALVDTDGSEALAVTVAGIPVGAILSDGTNLFTATAGNQSVAVTGWNLALLRVTPPLDADTDFTLAVTATATEALGGSATSAIANLEVDVVPVNDAPTIAAPPAMAVVEDVASPVTGIVIGDVDGTAGPVSGTLSVPSGTLAATSGAGVLVAGSGTGALALVGTTTAINAFLAAGSVTFTTALDATAPVPLSAFVNDLGNFGAGGPLLSPTIGVTLNVTAVNDAPVLGPVALSIDPLQTVTMTGGNMSATDVDNPAASLVFLVAGATNGQFELAAAPGVPVTSFTQAQLASGAVRFVHSNSGFGPSFSIFVTDGATVAGPAVAVVSFRAPGGEPPAPAKQPEPAPAPVEAGSDVLATGRRGVPEPTASDFVRTPFAPSGTAAVTFAEAPAETAIVLAQPVRAAALLDLRASGAPGDGFVEADRIPTGLPKMNFAIDTVRHDEAPHSFDVAFDSARITGMALSVGAVWLGGARGRPAGEPARLDAGLAARRPAAGPRPR